MQELQITSSHPLPIRFRLHQRLLHLRNWISDSFVAWALLLKLVSPLSWSHVVRSRGWRHVTLIFNSQQGTFFVFYIYGDNWLTRGNRNAASCFSSDTFRGKTYDLRRTYNLKCTKIPTGYDVSTTSRILKVARLVSKWESSDQYIAKNENIAHILYKKCPKKAELYVNPFYCNSRIKC